MSDFSYTIINKDGRSSKGILNAADREAALGILRQQGAKPLMVKEVEAHKKINLLGNKVKLKDLVIFTRELSTMISAGVSLPRGLETMATQTENKYFKTVINSINHDVESGMQLGDAMAKFPRVFNDVYVNMIRAGETGGILEEIMKRLATQVEKDASIRAKVKGAATYPMILMVITLGAFFVLTIFVVPKIGSLVTSLGGPDAKLPTQTMIMLGISSFIRNQWYLVAAFFVGGPILFRRWVKTPKGKQKFDWFLLKVPVIKTVVTKVAVARFARTFSSLMGAGVPVLQALEVTAKSLGNHVIQQELLSAAAEVKNGKQLSQPLAQSQIFPPIISQMMAVGEETGKMDTILVKVADFYEEEVDALINGLSSILEPIMIVVMGSMVGLIAASVIGPISNLTNNIQ